MFIVFCEECGGRNVIEEGALQGIENHAIACQVCSFPISTEHLINHTGAGRVIDTSTYKILIIDDDHAHLSLLQSSLENEYRVQIASSGVDGIAEAARFLPDLILLDVNMPDMNGYEVCSRLKANDATKHIAVVFISAQTAGDYQYQGLSYGAVDYIFKPFNLKILNAKIAALLRYNVMRDELEKIISEQNETISLLKEDILERATNESNTEHAQGTSIDKGKLRAIEQEKNNLVLIINSLLDGVSLQDADKKIIWANNASKDLFSASYSELQGKTCHKFYYDREVPCEDCAFGDTLSATLGEPVKIENTKLGLTFYQTHVSLYETDGTFSGVACTAQLDRGAESEERDGRILIDSLQEFLSAQYRELNDAATAILVSTDALCSMNKDDKKIAKLNDYIVEGNKRLRAVLKEFRAKMETE